MSVKVRFFASLRERVGFSDCEIEPGEAATVAEVWRTVCGDLPMDDNILSAVNLEYVDAAQPVNDGDEVAYFPPVTGG